MTGIFKEEYYRGYVISFHSNMPKKYVNSYSVKGKDPEKFGGFKVTGLNKKEALMFAKKYIDQRINKAIAKLQGR